MTESKDAAVAGKIREHVRRMKARLEEGRPTNLNLHEYKLPTVRDVPELETILLQPDLTLGITPIGEGPNCGLSACIVNAIVDAIGDGQVDIPVSPDAIRQAVAQR